VAPVTMVVTPVTMVMAPVERSLVVYNCAVSAERYVS